MSDALINPEAASIAANISPETRQALMQLDGSRMRPKMRGELAHTIPREIYDLDLIEGCPGGGMTGSDDTLWLTSLGQAVVSRLKEDTTNKD